MSSSGIVERRSHARVSLKGTTLLLAGMHAQRGRLVNLSVGGLLATTLVTPPVSLLGTTVDIELRLDGTIAKWQRVVGRITRIGNQRVAVKFETMPAELLHMIEEMISESGTRNRVLSVILVDGEPNRRAAIAEGFRAVGCGVIEAATPLEAIVRLGESSFEPDMIAIADSGESLESASIRAFVEREHPRVKLVSISDDALEPEGLLHWLSSLDPKSDLPHRILRLLARPNPT